MSAQETPHSDEKAVTDEHYEWHEQVGRAVMFAMRCTHEGANFGDKAVCVTCFDNAQSIGALVERFAYRAFEQGRQSERRDWELTADLCTPDEDRQPWPNPYCGPRLPPAARCPTCIHAEGYDRLSGPCLTCGGDGVIPPAKSGGDDR